MTRHIVWQAALALLGITLIFLILFQIPSDEPIPEVTVEVPAAGGTYIEGVLGYWELINPILAPAMVPANPVDQDLSALVFEGLTSLDTSGQVTPSLALDWNISEDGTVYEFRLRKGVTWHDGAPFTAADVAFTVQALQDPNYQGDANLGDLWRNVAVEQLDTYTVRFTLEDPFPSFIHYTTIGLLPAHLLSAVPATDLPSDGFSTQQPIGTGMLMVDSLSQDQVVLTANPSYWGTEPFLDQVEFWFYADWEGLLEDYQQGAVHGFHPPTLEAQSSLLGIPDLQLFSAQSAGYGIIYLNLQHEEMPFFQEKEVRQGLLYALDRQALIDDALAGQGIVADGPISPISWAYAPPTREYGHDPERAIGLLDATGWLDSNADRIRDKEEQELSFTLLTSDDPSMIRMAEEVSRQWRVVGVDATVRSVPNERLAAAIRDRSFDAALIEVGLTSDPDPYPMWHSTQAESGQNFAGFANEAADLVMEEARFTADPGERTELYYQFQQIFVEEVPSLPLYYPIYTYAVGTQVHEVQLSPLLHASDRFRNISAWYVQTEALVVSENGELDKSDE
jgi:peptide/nickel transport system substrate-binding protein